MQKMRDLGTLKSSERDVLIKSFLSEPKNPVEEEAESVRARSKR